MNKNHGNGHDKAGERQGPQTPLHRVVQQSAQSRHDRALSRALSQLRPDPRGIAGRQADHRHCADRQRPLPLQPASSRPRQPGARRHPRRRRHRHGIPDPSDPGNRKAPDRGARPQPRLSRPGRNPVRLSPRRRGADHRLRQDHAGLHDGGRDRQHARDRAVGRTDAERLAQGSAHRLRHRGVEGARGTGRPARSTTRSS